MQSLRKNLFSPAIASHARQESSSRDGKVGVHVCEMPEAIRQREEVEGSRTSALTRREKVHRQLSLLREEVHKVGECSGAHPVDSPAGTAFPVFRLWQGLQYKGRAQGASNHSFRYLSIPVLFLVSFDREN